MANGQLELEAACEHNLAIIGAVMREANVDTIEVSFDGRNDGHSFEMVKVTGANVITGAEPNFDDFRKLVVEGLQRPTGTLYQNLPRQNCPPMSLEKALAMTGDLLMQGELGGWDAAGGATGDMAFERDGTVGIDCELREYTPMSFGWKGATHPLEEAAGESPGPEL